MPKIHTLSDEDRKLGVAIARLAKLDPSIVIQDYDVQSHGDTVTIRLEVFHQMARSEFDALVASVTDKK